MNLCSDEKKSNELNKLVINKAMQLIIDKSYDEITLDDIAKRCHFRLNDIRKLFPSKQDVIINIINSIYNYCQHNIFQISNDRMLTKKTIIYLLLNQINRYAKNYHLQHAAIVSLAEEFYTDFSSIIYKEIKNYFDGWGHIFKIITDFYYPGENNQYKVEQFFISWVKDVFLYHLSQSHPYFHEFLGGVSCKRHFNIIELIKGVE